MQNTKPVRQPPNLRKPSKAYLNCAPWELCRPRELEDKCD